MGSSRDRRTIITKDAITPLYNEDGVLVMGLFDFLLNDVTLYRYSYGVPLDHWYSESDRKFTDDEAYLEKEEIDGAA